MDKQPIDHKEKRDELNQKVKEAKAKRDNWNNKLNTSVEKLAEKKRQSKQTESISELKKQLKSMEYQQSTSVLSLKQDKALVRKMSLTNDKIKKLKGVVEEDTEISKLIKMVKEARVNAQYYHNLVEELAEQAQQEHNAMVAFQEGGN